MKGPATMTVAELQEALNNFSPDALVLFANDYGDISHTMQVTGIDTIDESEITENAYSKSGWALPYPGDDDEDPDDPDPIDCPKNDPDCIGTDEMSHDACEPPQTFVVLR